MVNFSRDFLAQKVGSLTPEAAVAFAASCVQRRASAAQVLSRYGRSDDLSVFEQLLDDLWRAPLSEMDASTGDWDRLGDFEEISSDEDEEEGDEGQEAEGVLAFSEDAVVALWYAVHFLLSHDSSYWVDCAARCYDSAGFVDDISGGGCAFADMEAQLQVEDLVALESQSITEELLLGLREKSVRESERIATQLPSPDV